jgi:hypothetical protein
MPGHETTERRLTVRIRATIPLIGQQGPANIFSQYWKNIRLLRLWNGSRLYEDEEQPGHRKQEENGSQDPRDDAPYEPPSRIIPFHGVSREGTQGDNPCDTSSHCKASSICLT